MAARRELDDPHGNFPFTSTGRKRLRSGTGRLDHHVRPRDRKPRAPRRHTAVQEIEFSPDGSTLVRAGRRPGDRLGRGERRASQQLSGHGGRRSASRSPGRKPPAHGRARRRRHHLGSAGQHGSVDRSGRLRQCPRFDRRRPVRPEPGRPARRHSAERRSHRDRRTRERPADRVDAPVARRAGGVAWQPDGTLFVTTAVRGRVEAWRPDGSHLRSYAASRRSSARRSCRSRARLRGHRRGFQPERQAAGGLEQRQPRLRLDVESGNSSRAT